LSDVWGCCSCWTWRRRRGIRERLLGRRQQLLEWHGDEMARHGSRVFRSKE
jgi:hypothetical protein